jgi:hypothetical protein
MPSGGSDGEECGRLATCQFFTRLSLPAAGEALKALYCRSDYPSCARFRLAETGQAVPPDLWPDGKTYAWGASR